MVTLVEPVGERLPTSRFLLAGFDPIRTLLMCCTIVALVVATSAGLVIFSTHSNRMDEIRSELEKLSSVLADHADRTFEAMDLVELGLISELLLGRDLSPESFGTLTSDAAVHRRLRLKIAGVPSIDALSIIDSKGHLVNFSRYWPIPTVDVADRDYFQVLSQPNAPDVYISKPTLNRGSGTWTIYLARRIETKDGQFLGLVLAAMETTYMSKFFSGIANRPNDAISMLRTDGVLLARFPVLQDKVGQQITSNAIIANAVGQREFHRLTSVWDGLERFVATTRSTRYPLIINVSAGVSSALLRWKRQTWFFAAAAALLEIGIFVVAVVGSRELQGRLRLSHERAAKAKLIAEAELALALERETAADERSARNREFKVAIETMRQGLCMFDGDEKLVIFNRRVATDLGIPFECLLPGLSLQSLIALLEKHGTIDADGAARIRQSLSFSLSAPNTQTTIETLLDGRILSYSVRAMDQDTGWVLTCEDVTDRQKAEQRLLHISLHDPLTDLANRAALRARIEAEVWRARSNEGSALLYVDLDGFKAINDTLGHSTGDAVLQAVAKRLLRSTRSTDTVARVGGDEFVIVESSAMHPGSAATLAERIVAELRQPFEVCGRQIVVGASVGISFIQPGCADPDLFIKKADLALYEAKKDGGNCYRMFEPRLEIAATAKSKLSAELKEAVARQEFVVYYQPLVNVATRAICGFEALVRWDHPSRGLVAPGDFIELAEEIGLISQIGEQVLFQACAEAATWPKSIKIAVNLSPKQFGEHKQITATVQEALTWSGLDPGRLELEITESILLRGNEETVNILHTLKGLGVRISMDDFGTGYSSLSYLQKFPFDKIKIDQSFVQNMADDCKGDPIIHAIMALCKIVGLRTTAEGVETEIQFELLSREGCDEAQGYLFGRPAPADTIPDVIDRLSKPTNRNAITDLSAAKVGTSGWHHAPVALPFST